MRKQILYLVTAAIVGLAMNSCEENIKFDEYSLRYSNYNSINENTNWNGWKISVISKYLFWYDFESKSFKGDKTFYFTHASGKDSITVRNIMPGEQYSIGVYVVANGGTYTVNQTSTSGSYMYYWIGYNDYSQMIRFWTDDMIITETVSLHRRLTSFDSFRVINRSLTEED